MRTRESLILSGLLLLSLAARPEISFSATAPAASEGDCSDSRMDTGNGSVSRLPTYHQGESGLCYAYTASQMIDAWRFSHGDDRTDLLTSPLYTGAIYAQNSKTQLMRKNSGRSLNLDMTLNTLRDPMQDFYDKYSNRQYSDQKTLELRERMGSKFIDTDNGYIDLAIHDIRAKGSACNDADILGRKAQNDYKEKLGSLWDFRKKVEDLSDFQSDKPALRAELGCLLSRNLPRSALNYSADLDRILDKAVSPNDYLVEIFDAACNRRIDTTKIPEPQKFELKARFDGTAEPDKLSEARSKMLSLISKKGAQPIGIGYCGKVISPLREDCWPHASIVIGKKMIGGQCHVLLRNSYGRECDPEALGGPICEKGTGQLWVPVDDLLKATVSMTWLE